MVSNKRTSWEIFIFLVLVIMLTNNGLFRDTGVSHSYDLILFTDKQYHYRLVVYYIIRAFCCFVVVERIPIGVWFVPFLLNFITFGIMLQNGFWETPYWMFAIGGLVLCVIASIAGMKIGKRSTKPDNP